MLCLHCGHDEQSLGPVCGDCGSFVGYVADGRGYLPQLKVLEKALAEETVTAAEAEQRLVRCSEALETMINWMDECGQGLMSLEWDDVQQGTLGGFMMPLREALEKLKTLVDQLDCNGNWGEETWDQLDEVQTKVQLSSEGMTVLTQALAAAAVEKGVDFDNLFAPAETDNAEAAAES